MWVSFEKIIITTPERKWKGYPNKHNKKRHGKTGKGYDTANI